jgi:mRNA interferase MazF
VICDRWDTVAVPFPFVDHKGSKKRPALVVSNRSFNESGHSVLAMITTTFHHPWPGDNEIQDIDAAGLNTPCIIRLKLFTLDNRLILRSLGRLSHPDTEKITKSIRTYILS